MNNNLTQAAALIVRDFNLDQHTNAEQIKEALTNVLIYLLLNNIERLWGILYRIDVNEQQVKDLFNLQNPKAIAPALADLIIERQLQKIASRKKYK